ncbi:MAG: flagellar biosynthesis anti-sigma factor FlgM [Noviherbaspirillum sp.]
MKINDSSSINKAAPGNIAASQAGANRAAEKTGAAAAGSDNVRLSSQAKALSTTSTGGVFDTKKVEEIKAAIASGQFRVDAGKIADGLIDSVRDMIQKRK